MDSWDHSINEDVKEVCQGLKPEEELQRFSVDEQLSDVERTNLFLTGGQLVQQRKAIEGLPGLLKSKGRAGWDAVRDNLLLTLKQLDSEAQVSAAEGLRTAVQQHALPAPDAAACLLPLAIANVKLKDNSDEESEAWLLLLLELVPVVGAEQLLGQVLPLALAHGEVNKPVASRVVCCRLLGAMTPYLPPADVTARFGSKLMAACQDTDYQVRIAAAEQLPVLARGLGPAATISQLLPELSELLTDDEVQVRMSALDGLVALCELLPREARVEQLLPLVRRHMQPLELELPLQRTLAAAFTRLLAAVHDDLEPTDAGLMYSCFRHLAARTNVELRRTCAGCVSDLMASPLPGSSPFYLYDTWTDLAADHDEQVRIAIAEQLSVMAKHVPPADAARLLRRPLSALLRDTSPLVREALLSGLADTLQALASVDDLHREGLASDIHQGLLALQGNIADNWRCQQHMAAALPQLPSLLGPDVLADTWAPYAFSLLLNGAAAVKPSAARGLASLLRACRRERQRTDLYCRIMRELAWGRSCFARLAFIQLCVAALAVFSCRWFKAHLLLAVMDLLSDAVPNVRLVALALLPALKQTIRLPEDVQHLEQLNSAMSNLMTDNDRDVAHAARGLHATFKRTPLRMTGGAGMLDMSGSGGGQAGVEFEAADKLKEEGEAELTMVPEDLDRLTTEWAAVNAERKGRRNPVLALAEASAGSSGGSSSTAAGRLAGGKGPGASLASGGSSATAGRSAGSSQAGPAGYSVSSGSSSSSSSSTASGAFGAGRGTGAASAPSSGSAGWLAASTASGERRFGSAAASSSSSSSPSGGNLSMRTAAAAASAASGFSSMARTNARAGAAGGSSSNGPGSPRPGNVSTSNNSGSAFGPGSPQSPTGSALLAHMRLPVLAGSPKGAAGTGASSSGSNTTASAAGPSSSSSAGITAASRLAGWSGGLSSLGSPTAAAAAARAQPGSLGSTVIAGSTKAAHSSSSSSSSSSSMYGREGSKTSSSTSSSSRPGGLTGKGGTGAFGGSPASASRGVPANKATTAATSAAASAASRDVARRFR